MCISAVLGRPRARAPRKGRAMELEDLVGEARERQVKPMAPRERLVAGAIALGFLLAAGVVTVLVPVNRHADPLTLALLVLLAVAARRVMFEIGNNEACPDQLVFIRSEERRVGKELRSLWWPFSLTKRSGGCGVVC